MTACGGVREIGPSGRSTPLVSPAASLRLSAPPLPRCAERPADPIGTRFALPTSRLPRWLPRVPGEWRSEVLGGDAGRGPVAGDMSGAVHPATAARAYRRTESPA